MEEWRKRERDWSDDESRHVSPLNRVSFLRSKLAAAAAGIEFRCNLSLRSAPAATGGNALINTDCPSLTPA